MTLRVEAAQLMQRVDKLLQRRCTEEELRVRRLATADRLRRRAATPDGNPHRTELLETAAELERQAGRPRLRPEPDAGV